MKTREEKNLVELEIELPTIICGNCGQKFILIALGFMHVEGIVHYEGIKQGSVQFCPYCGAKCEGRIYGRKEIE